MGLLLSILFSYAGAIEFMFIVRDIVHRIGLHHEKMKFNRDQSNVTSTLHELQEDLRNRVKEARIQLYETDCIHSMADGVQYEDGYRISQTNGQNTETRAIASIEPSSHMAAANDVVKSIVNENQNNIDVTTDSKRGCSNSKITDSTDNEIAIDMNHLNGSNGATTGEMPNIHFDEYTHDKSSSYDSVTKTSGWQQQQQQQQKNADSGRRKSFKVYSNAGSHVTADEFQRRRSKDIDGGMDNPWGELRPENFHDANLWSRERAMSIAENEESFGCVDEKTSNNAIFKHDVKAPNRAAAITVPIHEKKNGKSFGEPDETYESDVSSEIPSSLPHYFDEVNPVCDDDHDDDGNSRAGQIRNVPEILVDGLDLNEIVGDYTIDDNSIELDKHQFKEYFEKPKRLRHSSYNYEIDEEDNEEDLNEFSIVEKNEAVDDADADEDDGEEQEGDEAADLVSENKSIDTNSVAKQGRKGRKPNMFASSFRGNNSSSGEGIGDHEHGPSRPMVRITATEDERVEHFLQEEHISSTSRSGGGDILIKSKTTQMFDCQDDENMDDGAAVATDSCESRANSTTSVASPMYVTRRESMVSDNGSEPPIQFECKQQQQPASDTPPNYFYGQREDSLSSNKSNELFERRRSQSHFSELEYIKGRDDWKDDYMRCSISEEIDSDNYHHLRRHSEAADTLEYIRGREDWLARNGELYRNQQQRTSLAQIFEVGEPKLLIQDEIDSDEYHHNFFQHSISEPGYASINELSECRKQNFQEQFVTENVGDNEIAASTIATTSTTTNSNNAHNEHPISLPSNARVFDKSNNDEIDVVIEDLIKHDTINNDDIEITVWDLTPECHKNNPFIFISEAATTTTSPTTATADNQDLPNDERNSKQSDGLLDPNSVDTSISTELTSNISSDSECHSSVAKSNTTTITTSNNDNNGSSSSNSKSHINEFLNAEIQCETKNRPQHLSDDKIEKQIEIESNENKRSIRAKSERIGSMTAGLLNPKDQKPRRTLSFENVEDLIEQSSNGPWFHK